MDTTGEPSAKRFKRTHRGRRSSTAQTKREQKNEWYFPGSCAFAWLAQNYGTESCSVDPANDGKVMEKNERMRQTEEAAEQARQLLEAHRTAGQMLKERMNRTEASVTGTSPAGGSRPDRAQVPEAPGADDGRFGFGAFAARYQPESFSGEDTEWRDWSRLYRTWAGRFQRG